MLRKVHFTENWRKKIQIEEKIQMYPYLAM